MVVLCALVVVGMIVVIAQEILCIPGMKERAKGRRSAMTISTGATFL